MTTNIAPVIIPTMCRYEHLKKCLHSLSQNYLANQTDIYISVDYPNSEAFYQGYSSIKNYLNKEIEGFGSVTVFFQDRNLGALENYYFLLDYITRKYDRFIYLEDDLVFSTSFLQYMNDCLSRYEKDNQIVGVLGYSHSVDWKEKNSTIQIFNNEFNCWGYGSWSEKIIKLRKFVINGELDSALKNPISRRKILKYRPDYMPYVNKYLNDVNTIMATDKKIQLIDITKTMYLILEDKRTVMPTITKVNNIGFDGSGANCQGFEIKQQLLVNDNWEHKSNMKESVIKCNMKTIRRHFIFQKVFIYAKKLLSHFECFIYLHILNLVKM